MHCHAKHIFCFSLAVVLPWTAVPTVAFTLRFAPVIELQPDPEQGATMRAIGPLCEKGQARENEPVLALFRPFYCGV